MLDKLKELGFSNAEAKKIVALKKKVVEILGAENGKTKSKVNRKVDESAGPEIGEQE